MFISSPSFLWWPALCWLFYGGSRIRRKLPTFNWDKTGIMTKDLLDFWDEEQRLHRLRLFKRTRLSLLIAALTLSLANVVFIFTTIPVSTPIIEPAAFAGWSATYVLIGTMVIAAPALAYLVGSVLALIPIKTYPYLQRMAIAVLALCTLVEGLGLCELIRDYLRSPGR